MFMPVGWAWKTTLILCMAVWRGCRSGPATPHRRTEPAWSARCTLFASRVRGSLRRGSGGSGREAWRRKPTGGIGGAIPSTEVLQRQGLNPPQPLAVMPFMADDPDTQVDGLERLTDLAKHASP